jgi:hypothetical protein
MYMYLNTFINFRYIVLYCLSNYKTFDIRNIRTNIYILIIQSYIIFIIKD